MNTHLFSLHLLSFFFISSLPFPSLAATTQRQRQRCHPDDYKALMKIKNDLGNPYDLTNWQTNTDYCDWCCLRCDIITNRVDELFISGNMSGQIPSSVADLPYLQSLAFRKNPNITGSIPSSILKLKRLQLLWMDWNSLSGPIPDFIGQIKTLNQLDLSFNQFSGSIPSSLSNLNKLNGLFLSRNKLTGSIPESKISGMIPEQIMELNLYGLNVSYNLLCGKIPFGGKLPKFDYSSYFHNKCLCGTPLPACKGTFS